MTNDEVLRAVVETYTSVGIPTDRLPYTRDFTDLHRGIQSRLAEPISELECWRLLTRARKRGLLPRLCR